MVTTLAALRATKTLLTDHTFLFQGAGEAAIGIANLIVMALEKLYEIPRLVKMWFLFKMCFHFQNVKSFKNVKGFVSVFSFF